MLRKCAKVKGCGQRTRAIHTLVLTALPGLGRTARDVAATVVLCLVAVTFTGSTGCIDCTQCTGLSPSPDPEENFGVITGCLQTCGHAMLGAGDWPVVDGIEVPQAAILEAEVPLLSTIRLTSDTAAANYLVKLTSDGTVRGLRLDSAGALPDSCCSATISIQGSGNTVDQCEIFNTGGPPPRARGTGVYFICGDCERNIVSNSDIHDHFLGVIFGPDSIRDPAIPVEQENTLEGNRLFGIQCDPVTLVSFGRVIGNEVFHNGWDCDNGPIPGGGIYVAENPHGGEVVGNDVYDVCGHGIDIHRGDNLLVASNNVSNPGYQWNGQHPHCAGMGLTLADSSYNTVQYNVVLNNNRPSNAIAPYWCGERFQALNAAPCSDLPDWMNSDTTIAFGLLRTRIAFDDQTVGNIIFSNTFRSFCAPEDDCLGLGYFANRGTGYGPNGVWTPATANGFYANDPFGSQIGSVRCGRNAYAAEFSCPSHQLCNVDDEQHLFDSHRNDGCYTYCQAAPDGTACDDDNVCNGAETCEAGVCAAAVPLDCDDGDPCTSDSCDPQLGCLHGAIPGC